MNNPEHQIDDLILKLRNLHILLEEAVLNGAHIKARDLISEISETINQIQQMQQTSQKEVRTPAG
jgi:hypothetical protein